MLNKKLPPFIRVGAYKYKIKVTDKNIKHEEDDCYGICERDEKTIYLRSDLKGLHREEILIHELIHAVEDAYKIKLREKQVETLGLALAGIINDNKYFK